MVKVVCYRKEKIWESREEAMDFYLQGMLACDGSERDRYATIYLQLLVGLDYCTDEYDM